MGALKWEPDNDSTVKLEAARLKQPRGDLDWRPNKYEL